MNVPNCIDGIVLVPAVARGSLRGRPNVVRNVAFNFKSEMVVSLNAQERISVTLVPVEGQGSTPTEVGHRSVYLTQE
jgi:hypothetical protein